MPHDIVKKKPKSTSKQVELKPRLNNANSIGSIDGIGSDENDVHSSDNNLNNSGRQESEYDLIDKRMKNLKVNNDLDKVKSLLELKQMLESEKRRKTTTAAAASAQPQFDLNQLNVSDLEDCLKILSNNINSNKEKINNLKTKSASAESEEDNSVARHRHSSALLSLDDEIKRSLGDLDTKFNDFEKQTGKQNQKTRSHQHQQAIQTNSTSSSYTLLLIKMIARLIDYLKETQLELNHEKLKQTESNKQLDIHRKLIDGLTTEILCVKDQNEKLSDQNEKLIKAFANQQAKVDKMEIEIEQIKVKSLFEFFY